MQYEEETMKEYWKLTNNTVSQKAHLLGLREEEPLIVMMDCLLKYAKAYKLSYESNLVNDHILGKIWLDAAKAVRGLLDGDGAIAMRRNITTDSKDNGCVESMFCKALDIAGFTEEDV